MRLYNEGQPFFLAIFILFKSHTTHISLSFLCWANSFCFLFRNLNISWILVWLLNSLICISISLCFCTIIIIIQCSLCWVFFHLWSPKNSVIFIILLCVRLKTIQYPSFLFAKSQPTQMKDDDLSLWTGPRKSSPLKSNYFFQ